MLKPRWRDAALDTVILVLGFPAIQIAFESQHVAVRGLGMFLSVVFGLFLAGFVEFHAMARAHLEESEDDKT